MRRITIALMILTLGWALSGCPVGLDCTAIGCTDGAELTFAAALVAPGEYVVRVDVDGELFTCESSIPLVEGEESVCDAPDVFLMTSGSALTDGHAITGVMVLRTGVARIDIEVDLDDSLLASTWVEPAFETLQPNGPDCEPTCEYAAETVPFPPFE
jgi:hypothetical protein